MLTYKRLLIMLAVDILGDSSYGSNIAGFTMNTTRRHQTLKTGVYPMVHRLVELGYLKRWVNVERPPHTEKLREGRPFYGITRRGRRELNLTISEIEKFIAEVRKFHSKLPRRRCASLRQE